MRTFDALWQAYRADTTPTWRYEYKAVIDGQTYTDAEMWGFEKRGGLVPDAFSLGNCMVQELTLEVVEKTGVTVGKNARAEVFVRITGDSGATTWYSLGVFFIDKRRRLEGGKLAFECLDRMAYLDVPFLTDGELLDDYPMAMSAAMTRIYTQLGTTLDARNTISGSLNIEYPNDMTMRQVAAQIASAHGGNFIITEDDKLRLVVPGYGTALAAISGTNAVKTVKGNTPTTYDSVAMIYTEEGAYYESGATKLVTLDITNTWATQAMCDAVAAIIAGYTYSPYEAQGADLDPAIELGDHITIDGVACNVWKWTWNNRLYCDISVPSTGDDAVSEFGYTGTLMQALAKKLSLGAVYFGTTISRAEGLKIVTSDGSAEALFNAGKFALRALEEGTMVDKVYFDPATGKYVFDGDLSAETIAAVSAEIDVVISNTIIVQNLYSQMGNIARLTVNRLLTEDVLEDANLMDYIDIKDNSMSMIHGIKDVSAEKIQYTDENGVALYWTDGTETQMSTTATAYPVLVSQYDNQEKMKIWFNPDDENHVPEIVMGIGDGVKPMSAKGVIKKDVDGLVLKYYAENTGDLRYIKLGNDGIELNPGGIQYAETKNTAEISVGTSDTSLGIMGATTTVRTRMTVNMHLMGTASADLSATLIVKLNGTAVAWSIKPFKAGIKDQMLFTGIMPIVAPGAAGVELFLKTDTGTLTITAGDMNAYMEIRGGIVQELPPYPVINVSDELLLLGVVDGGIVATIDGDANSGISDDLSLVSIGSDEVEIILTTV